MVFTSDLHRKQGITQLLFFRHRPSSSSACPSFHLDLLFLFLYLLLLYLHLRLLLFLSHRLLNFIFFFIFFFIIIFQFTVGLAPETLRRSNLGSLVQGSKVNLERALKADGRNSGTHSTLPIATMFLIFFLRSLHSLYYYGRRKRKIRKFFANLILGLFFESPPSLCSAMANRFFSFSQVLFVVF
jgi:Lumazine binding domain